jgi:fimbrial chaperone protein
MKEERRSTRGARFLYSALWLAALLTYGSVAEAASFDVQPVKIFLDGRTKAEKLTITNQADSDATLQIKAYRWNQNEKGEDLYEETSDIIVFPRLMTLKRGEERFVRIATKVGQEQTEKAYRVYIEQIPAQETAGEGATVRLYIRMGVPVFLGPLASSNKGDIESASLKDGKLEVRVANNGNAHFVVTSVKVTGEDREGVESFSRDIAGWYLLSGVTRAYETSIPLQACSAMSAVNIEVATNTGLSLKQRVPVEVTKCGQTHAAYSYDVERERVDRAGGAREQTMLLTSGH